MRNVIAVAGPTASGKTKFSIEIAERFGGEIVSCDSMQLYKYMDIGSAKPTPEEMARVQHHLVDLIDPRDDFSVASYQRLARAAIEDILSRGRLPVIAGGTGLYLNALLYDMDFSDLQKDDGYRRELETMAEEDGGEKVYEMLREKDREAADSIHPHNVKKVIRALERLHQGEDRVHPFSEVKKLWPGYDMTVIGITRDREELYDRINRRVDILMDTGLVDEVRSLAEMGLTADCISMKGIGYKEVFDYLEGSAGLDETVSTIKKNTRHYAKKQLTWYRRYDRIKWYNISEYSSDEEAAGDMIRWLETRI